MVKSSSNLEEMFLSLAKAQQDWFSNLVESNKAKGNDVSGNALVDMYQQFFANTHGYLAQQQSIYQEQIELWQDFFKLNQDDLKEEISKPQDRRFTDPEWESNPFFAYLKQSYLKMSDYLVDVIAKSDMDAEKKDRLQFFVSQYLNAVSPTNFAATNPEVIKQVVETGGMSLVDGMKNMAEDMQNGYITMTDESLFAIGDNLAITPGAVIFRNDLIELIQYSPTTESVYQIPILIVPPCINKFYILDLQPDNSMVRYLVGQGYTVFLISWKSADAGIKDYRWEEYINFGVIKAIEVIRKISKQDKINTLGYCIGGIILTTASIILKEYGLDWINSMSHMTTMLDHTDPGDIRYFIDRDLMEIQAAKEQDGGIMSGRIISQTFSSLRANELIWNYWVNNYLMGKTPQPFDILFWNNDAVDLPVLMHSFLMKRLYAYNDLVKGKIVLDSVKMDLSALEYPMYLFAAQKDHIVPWMSAFKTVAYAKNKDVRFVLGASGHTAGVVNPATQDKRNYWVNDDLTLSAEDWFKGSTQMPGSWWKDFSHWLIHLSGDKVKAKKTLGNAEFKPLVDAPGEYVLAKAMPLMKSQTV